MARIRSVKPEFWLDRKLARKLSRDERMLYMGLWNQADEHGRALGDPVVVKGAIFPYDEDLTTAVIDGMLDALHRAEVVQRYDVDGDPYLFLPKLRNHQRLEPHKSKSKHPEPPPQSYPQPDSGVVSDDLAPRRSDATVFSESGHGSVTSVSDQQEESIPRTATIFSDESAHDPGKESLLYGTGSMEQGGRGADSSARTDPPTRTPNQPPRQPYCDDHPGGTAAPCGPCAGARKRWIAWNLEREEEAAEAERIRAEQAAAEKRAATEARAQAIANCNLCDASGYVTTDEGASLCAHDPEDVDRRKRGMAGVRERMGWKAAAS